MAAPRVKIILGADDKQAQKKLRQLGKDVSKFSQGVKKNVGGSFDFIGKVAVAGFAMLTAGKAATAIKDFATEGDRLAKTSKVIGLTAESLQELEYAAGQQGASAQSLNSAFVNMNKTLGRAKNEQGLLFSYLNKSNKGLLTQVQNAKSSEEAFALLTNAIDQETDTATRQALATAAFGGAASDMIKMADGGTAAIDKLREAQRKHGVISNEAAAASEKFNDEMDNATRAMKGVMFTALAPLIPKFTELAQKVTDFFHANRELIGSGIEKFFNGLSTAIDTLAFLWNSGLLPALAAGYIAFTAINAIVGIVTGVMGAYKTMQIALGTATMFATAKQWLLNAAMAANPIGLVIIAIAALIAIGILLYKNWDTIEEYSSSAWSQMKEWIPMLNQVQTVMEGVNEISRKLITGDWEGLTAKIGDVNLEIMKLIPGMETAIKLGKWIGNKFSGESSSSDESQGANGLVTRNQGVIESNKTTTNRSQLDVNFNNMPANASTSIRGTAPGININTGVMQGL